MSTERFSVELIGGARIVRSDGERALERKAAGLLAYLALSGATKRTRIAGLLWPESPERTARNNLVQAIRRLGALAKCPVVEGANSVAITRLAEVDVVRLEVLVQRGKYGEAVARRGTLLDGCDYDDCSEFDAWLVGQRERVRRALLRASVAESERLEAEGDLAGALDLTIADLRANGLDEDAHRRKMRLVYLKGDIAGALRVFDECRAALEAELGVAPHPRTAALAEEIRKGGSSLRSARPRTREHPPLAAHAPLVGRSAACDRIEQAWLSKKGVFLLGDPGVGKTRLMLEFAASRGDFTLFEARPGDATVPYATHARAYRQMLTKFSSPLPDWVRHELARILPELGKSAPTTRSALDKVRFLEANSQAFQLAVAGGMNVVCFDDFQFADPASVEAAEYVFSKYWSGELTGVQTVFSLRRGTIGADLEARIGRVVDAGLVASISLEPLECSDVEELLSKTEPALAARADEITQITGGNPFYVLELVKSFRAGGAGGESVDAALTSGVRIRELVKLRIDALSPGALRLARLAAIAGPEFDMRLAADVLEMPAIDLSDPLDELQQASVFTDQKFAHDLLHETVSAGVPAAVKAFVHERVAQHLTQRDAAPARVAHHFLEAGCHAEAAPLLFLAAKRARSLSRIVEAADLYERAARIYESQGDRSRAFEAFSEAGRFMTFVDVGDRFTANVESTDRLASTDSEWARSLAARGCMEFARGRLTEANRAAMEAAPLAERAHDLLAQAEACQLRFRVEMRLNHPTETARALERFEQLVRELGDPEGVVAALVHQGDFFALEDRHREAILGYRKAVAELVRWGDLLYTQGMFLGLVARSQLTLGCTEEAAQTLVTAASHFATLSASAPPRAQVRLIQAECDVVQERFGVALQALDELSRPGAAWPITCDATLARAGLLVTLQRTAEALAALAALTSDARTLPVARAEAILIACRTNRSPGDDDVRFVREHGTPLQRARLDLRRAHASTREDLEASLRALAEIERLEAKGHLAEAHARICESHSALGNRAAAVLSADAAAAVLETCSPVCISRGEILSTRARVLASTGAPLAADANEQARAWFQSALGTDQFPS